MNCKRTSASRLRNRAVTQKTRGRKKMRPKAAVKKRRPRPQEAAATATTAPDFAPPAPPQLRTSDSARLCPRYAALVKGEGVEVADLNALQCDLETLITACVLRRRALAAQLKTLSCDGQPVKRKRGRPFGSRMQAKRKRQVYPGPYDVVLKKRVARASPPASAPAGAPKLPQHHEEAPVKHKVPIITSYPNSASDFWAFIEPFCADVSNDNIAFLDELIRECSRADLDEEVPPLAENYAMKWPEEMLAQYAGYRPSAKAKLKGSTIAALKNADMHMMLEKFSTPMTERLLAAFLEEKVVSVAANAGGDFLKNAHSAKAGDCLAERLKSELIEQGVLDDDLPKPDEDDVLGEIAKCQSELAQLNGNNVAQLNKLRDAIAKDRQRQAVKEALDDVDKRIMEIYEDILLAKQQQPNASRSPAGAAVKKHVLKRFEKEASEIIKKQIRLHKEIIKLTSSEPSPPSSSPA